MSVEFRLPDKVLMLDWDAIHAYLKELSFAFGRPLLCVGYSVFDREMEPIEMGFRRALGPDTWRFCAEHGHPPVELGPIVEPSIVGQLMKCFRANAATFGISDVLDSIWTSEIGYLAHEVPVLAGALESLANAWFKMQEQEVSAAWIPDDRWKAYLAPFLKKLREELVDEPCLGPIQQTLKRANVFGMKERFRRFLSHLELSIGEVEGNAVELRHKVAHGGFLRDDEFTGAIFRADALRTLVNRVILRLLEWPGQYVDYSSIGRPSRVLTQPLGGPHGDGEPFDFEKRHQFPPAR